MSSKFGRIGPRTLELAALERMKKIPKTYNGENDVITFSPLFLLESFSYLQVMRPLVSMATDRVIVGKTASSRFLEHFRSDSFHTCR